MNGLRTFFFGTAILLACAAVTVVGSYFYFQPTILRVVIPSTDSTDARIFGAVAENLRSQRASVRLQVVTRDSPADALSAIKSRAADLAVLRSDLAGGGNVQTVLILRTEAGVFVVPKGSKVKDITDVPKGKIGVVRDVPVDGGLLPLVFDYYGAPRPNLNIVILKLEEVAAAIRERKIDVLIAVGPVSSKAMADIISEGAKGSKTGLTFVDIEEATAIAHRFSSLEAIEVGQGAFGGRPPRPAESFNTLGYSIRLVAHEKIDPEAIAELVKQVMNNRQSINAIAPFAQLIQTPDPDEASSFVIHSGTRMFINGEQKNFFDRYSDYIYLGLFLGSGIGSVATGALSWAGARRRRNRMIPIMQLKEALDDLSEAKTPEEVDAVEQQSQAVFRSALSQAVNGDLDSTSIATFELAMSEARSRIAAQRAAIAAAAAAR